MTIFPWNCTGLWLSNESTARHIFLELPFHKSNMPLRNEEREKILTTLQSLLHSSDESVLQAILLMESLPDMDLTSVIPCIHETENTRLHHMSYSRGEQSFEEGIFVLQEVEVYESSIWMQLVFPVTQWEVSFNIVMKEADSFCVQRTNKMGTSETQWTRYEASRDEV